MMSSNTTILRACIFNPLILAMDAYIRPAKAIGVDYGRIYAFGKSY